MSCFPAFTLQQSVETLATAFRLALPDLFEDAASFQALKKALQHLRSRHDSTKSQATHAKDTKLLSVIGNIGDLQTVGPAALQAAKAKMEVVFEAHRLKPGDAGFVYDKRTEFMPSAQSEWDEE